MDMETMFKKRILGDNYTYIETSAVLDTLAISFIREPKELSCEWPAILPAREVRAKVSSFLGQIFKQESHVIMPILESKAT